MGDKLNECYDFHKSPLPELLNSWPSGLSGGANIAAPPTLVNMYQYLILENSIYAHGSGR